MIVNAVLKAPIRIGILEVVPCQATITGCLLASKGFYCLIIEQRHHHQRVATTGLIF